MKRSKCPKCGKSVMKTAGDSYDRKRPSKRDKKNVEGFGFGFSYGGSYKRHKCR